MKTDFDIIISGGGLAGLTLAILTAQHGFKTLCVDKQKAKDVLKASHDGRTTAISYGSRQLLDGAGLWDALDDEACPINDIHIRDGSTPTLLRFLSDEVEGKSFGWIVDNQKLRAHLIKTAQKTDNLTYKDGVGFKDFSIDKDVGVAKLDDNTSYTSKLIIGADGRGSFVRNRLDIACKTWTYDQSAIVFIAYHDQPHNNIAVEHFRDAGPFAILPMNNDKDGTHRSSVVWTEHGEAKAFHFDDDAFLAAVQTRFGDYFGNVLKTGKRFIYPLTYLHADEYVAARTALVAEAAHVLHPIAGQGLNMSLRDVAALVEVVVSARDQDEDIGSLHVLKRYETWRKKDNRMMGVATDGLNRLFSNRLPAIRAIRNAGLEIVRNTPFAKQFFMRQAMGNLGNLPRLIKGEKL